MTSYSIPNGQSRTYYVGSGDTLQVDAGGTSQNSSIYGSESVYGSSVGDLIYTGGQQTIWSGVAQSNIINGGSQTVYTAISNETLNSGSVRVFYGNSNNTIVNGGTLSLSTSAKSNGDIINQGGTETLSLGGGSLTTVANVTINGGSLKIGAGVKASGTITFGNGGSLEIDDPFNTFGGSYGATIVNARAGDLIDLVGFAYTPYTTATISNGSLLVTNGAVSESFLTQNASVQSFAVSADGKGGTLLTAVATPPLSVAVDLTSGGFVNGRTPILTGSVVNPDGSAKVELYAGDPAAGGRDLGAATVKQDGTWVFKRPIGVGDFANITAVATNAQGTTASAVAAYELLTGVTGQAYRAVEYDYTPDGSYSYTQYGQSGNILASAQDNGDGSHTTEAYADGLNLSSIHDDVFTSYASRETYTFYPGFAQDEITNFNVAGADHDVIDLSNTRYQSLVQILQHTTMSNGSATIHLNPTDSITLDGVTRAQIKAHPEDVAFA